MSLIDYVTWYKHRPLIWKIINLIKWRLSYLKAFFLGGPCAGERLLLKAFGKVDFFDKERDVYCSECGWGGTSNNVAQLYPYIEDAFNGLKPGEEVPAGMCPKCNGLLYLAKKEKV
jgi:hypothetical protein